MKIFLLIAALAVGGILLLKQRQATAPATTVLLAEPAPQIQSPSPAATPSALRRPIARTQDVLGEVKQRNGDGEF